MILLLAAVDSFALHGIVARPVRVEVDVTNGLPSLDLVGLPDTAVREAKERVRAAIRNSGYEFPLKRITVNLSPAAFRKTGSHFDLAVAAAILLATGQAPPISRRFALAGELSLDGRVRGVPGVLPMALAALKARSQALLVSPDNEAEARAARGLRVVPVRHLNDLITFLREGSLPTEGVRSPGPPARLPDSLEVDLRDIRGQVAAKRALEVAAAGGHHLLMVGPPGSGKTLLGRALAGLLPPFEEEERLESSSVHSVAGLLRPEEGLLERRPFRSPHHTTTRAGLIGGGSPVRPGEASLAHNGVLFLDEFSEWSRETLESLREPLESGEVALVRQGWSVRLPARFSLVMAGNPCFCGYYLDEQRRCRCSLTDLERYRRRLSGPLLDRIDVRIRVWRPRYEELQQEEGESSAVVAERVRAARERQRRRLAEYGLRTNGQLPPRLLGRVIRLSGEAEEGLRQFFRRRQPSARAYHRILRLARTIADLAGSDGITRTHVLEAVGLWGGLDGLTGEEEAAFDGSGALRGRV